MTILNNEADSLKIVGMACQGPEGIEFRVRQRLITF